MFRRFVNCVLAWIVFGLVRYRRPPLRGLWRIEEVLRCYWRPRFLGVTLPIMSRGSCAMAERHSVFPTGR